MFKFFRRKAKSESQSIEKSEQPIIEHNTHTEPPIEKPVHEQSGQPVVEEFSLPETADAENKQTWFNRLKSSLSRTRSQFSEGLADLFLGKKSLDADLLDDIESRLLMADVGVKTTALILDNLKAKISRKAIKDPQAVFTALKECMVDILQPCEQVLDLADYKPFVILMVGVNGAGKTTTIGKLATYFQQAGLSVQLAAGDTFRAAAIEQLQVWGERNNVPVVAQHQHADSASVVFDALESAQAKNIDILIADTAGRLQAHDHLMEELKKISRVMKKRNPNAPHEILLVLDASLGQNSLLQAQKFHEALNVTGIVLTKLDGTAKGGIIFAIASQLQLPIRFIGVGETLSDLKPFEAKTFVDALFS